MKWYYSDAGQQIGPIDDAAFQALVNRGVIRDDTQVWREGMAGWAPYSTVKPAVPVTPAAQAYVPPVAAAPIPPAAQPAQFMPPAAAAAVAKAEASGLFFFYPVLKALNDGRIIRRAVIIVLQILAVLSVLGGLFAAFTLLSSGGGVAAILGGVVMLAAILCVAQIFWYRAASVRDLEAEPEDHFGAKFTVIPIASMLFRLLGEISATMLVGLGISTFFVLLLSSSDSPTTSSMMRDIMPIPMGGTGIGPALISLVGMSAMAFVSIVVFYLLAESTVVMVDVAQHIRILVKQGESKK
jgi:hypothetical protein